MIYVPDINYDYYYYSSPYIYAFNSSACTNTGYQTRCNATRYDISNHYFNDNVTITLYDSTTYLSKSNLSTDFYYRNDLDSILICFIIIVIVGFGIPWKLLSRLFWRLK